MADVESVALDLQDFEPHVGSSFSIVADDLPPLPMKLEEARALKQQPGQKRAPFDLVFRGDGNLLPQGLYRFRHEAMGDVAIFIVPLAQDADGVQYCATFN